MTEVEVIESLRQILTPHLLRAVYDLLLPEPGLSGTELWDSCYGVSTAHTEARLRELVLKPALIPISRIPMSDMPKSFLTVLPCSLEDSDFPVLALGLICLLDQAPRWLLSGTDTYWTNGFFDVLALRIAQEHEELPAHLKLSNVERWMRDHPSMTWEDAVRRSKLAMIPFVHAEDKVSMRIAQDDAERRKTAVEERYGCEDPSRHSQDAQAIEQYEGTKWEGATAFSKLMRGPKPPLWYADHSFTASRIPESCKDKEDACRHAALILFQCQVTRSHGPILSRFGRYPFRNGALGREDTPEEVAFMEETRGFGTGGMSSEARRKIAESVKGGSWPLLSAD
ncbi:hypothetical protein EMMF5_001777 [Cystobasidiomycetes sp. EMM_F5]